MIALKSIDNGWLELCFNASCEAKAEAIRLASKTCDPPSELAAALLNIAATRIKDDARDREISPHFLFWEVKPCLYTCSLAPCADGEITIELHHCPDMYAGIHTADELRIRAVVRLDIMAANLFEEMRGLLSRYGLIGYRRRWGRDFPLALFLELYELLYAGIPSETTDIRREAGLLQEILRLESEANRPPL